MYLVVTEPFGEHQKGSVITDGIDEVLASHPTSVVKVDGEPATGDANDVEEPAPQPAPPSPAPVSPPAPVQADGAGEQA